MFEAQTHQYTREMKTIPSHTHIPSQLPHLHNTLISFSRDGKTQKNTNLLHTAIIFHYTNAISYSTHYPPNRRFLININNNNIHSISPSSFDYLLTNNNITLNMNINSSYVLYTYYAPNTKPIITFINTIHPQVHIHKGRRNSHTTTTLPTANHTDI